MVQAIYNNLLNNHKNNSITYRFDIGQELCKEKY